MVQRSYRFTELYPQYLGYSMVCRNIQNNCTTGRERATPRVSAPHLRRELSQSFYLEIWKPALDILSMLFPFSFSSWADMAVFERILYELLFIDTLTASKWKTKNRWNHKLVSFSQQICKCLMNIWSKLTLWAGFMTLNCDSLINNLSICELLILQPFSGSWELSLCRMQDAIVHILGTRFSQYCQTAHSMISKISRLLYMNVVQQCFVICIFEVILLMYVCL